MPTGREHTSDTRRKRRRLQFSLRTLLVLAALIACASRWVILEIDGFRKQRAQIDAFVADGFGIETKPAIPSWLAKVLGDADGTTFVNVVGSYFRTRSDFPCRPMNDRDLEVISRWSSLDHMRIWGAEFSDSGMCHLAGKPHLWLLQISDTPIGDEGLRHLRGLSGLTDLDLYKTRTTDSGLSHLSGLQNLERLELDNCQVTGIGFRHLSNVPLQHLGLAACPVTDEGLREVVRACPGLTTLRVSAAGITNAGMREICGLTKLVSLSIDAPSATHPAVHELDRLSNSTSLQLALESVTDTDIPSLLKLKSLSLLQLSGLDISDESLFALGKIKALRGVILVNGHVSTQTARRFRARYPSVFRLDLSDKFHHFRSVLLAKSARGAIQVKDSRDD